jgi:hypothetical protein
MSYTWMASMRVAISVFIISDGGGDTNRIGS